MAKRSSSRFQRISLWLIILVLLIGVGGYTVSLYPQWGAPLVEAVLKQRGITVRFSELQGKWQGARYQLTGNVSAQMQGARVNHAAINAVVTASALWEKRPFIQKLALDNVDANLAIDQVLPQVRHNDATAPKAQNFLPQSWSIHCLQCDVSYRNYRFKGQISGDGQADQQANLILSDSQIGQLALQYDAKTASLTAQSEQLNMQRMTGYALELSGLSADIDLKKHWQSQIKTKVNYQNISSEIHLQGEGDNQLRLDMLTQGETLTLFAKRQAKTVTIHTDKLAMELLNQLKPVILPFVVHQLPPKTQAAMASLDLVGQLSGQVSVQFDDKGIVPQSADVEFSQLDMRSDSGTLTNLSGRLSYAEQAVNYHLNLTDSTLLLPTVLSQSLTAITGEIRGKWVTTKPPSLPDTLTLTSPVFQQLKLRQVPDELLLQLEQVDAQFLSALHAGLLPLAAEQLSPELLKTLEQLQVQGKIDVTASVATPTYQLKRADVGLQKIDVNIANRQLTQLSGQMQYHDDKLRYQLDFSDSQLIVPEWLPKPLMAISGHVKGTFSPQQALLPDEVNLTSNAFDKLSLTQQERAFTLQVDKMDSTWLNAVKPIILAQLSDRLPSAVQKPLTQLTAQGKLSVKATLDKKTYQPQQIQLGLHQFGLDDKTRQITNVSGEILSSGDKVDYRLKLNKSVVKLPAVFTEKLPKTTGEITGQYDRRKQQVAFKTISLSNKDVDTLTAQGSVTFKESIVTDLSGGLRNLSLNRLPLYLTQYFPPQTHAFLTKALVSGKKNTASFVLKGDIDDFMKKNFIFKIDVEANDGVFHYLSNNPDIAIKKAKVTIDGEKLSVSVDDAQLFTTIKKKTLRVPLVGTAVIDNMNAAEIDVKAMIKSQPMTRLIRIAERSLAKESIKKVKKVVDINGHFDVALDLWLDVHSPKGKETFTVRLNSNDATAVLKDYPTFIVKRAKATAVINDDGLQSVNINGKVNQQPIHIDIAPFKQKKQSGIAVRATAKQADILTLLKQLELVTAPQAKLLNEYRLIRGQTEAKVDIRLQETGTLIDVGVTSDLRGTAIDAFGLLTKDSSSQLPLRIDYQAQSKHLVLRSKEQLHIEIDWDKNDRMTGFVVDNHNSKTTYQSGVGRINWYAHQFDLASFSAFYKGWSETMESTTSKMPALAYQIDTIIDNVRISAERLEPVQLQGSLKHLRIASPLLSGVINYQHNHLDADIARIEVDNLFDLFKTQDTNPEGRQVTTLDLARDLPTMNINVAQVIFNNSNIGNATINTSIQQGRYSIDQLLVNGRGFYLDVSGFEAAEQQGVTTHIFADFKAENLHDVIKRFQFNEVLDAKFLDVSLNLSWPGKANTLNLRQSYGKATLNAQNIEMINMSSGVGSVFGMMDIVGILKRVSMDFENLNSSKLSFDTIQGRWNIGGGRAMTRDAYATGSLVELQLVGGADLHRRVFDDMNLTVIPKASNVFPVIGAVAGGVVGGAAGLLVQQVIGDNINQAVGLPYVISGDWQNPNVAYTGAGS